MQQWQQQKISESGIADAMVNVFSGSKKLQKEVTTQIISNEQDFCQLSTHFKMVMYNELKYKFRAWVCLQQIDLNPTISFRGYEIIHNTDFLQENNHQYR